jgi:hypothetical protein
MPLKMRNVRSRSFNRSEEILLNVPVIDKKNPLLTAKHYMNLQKIRNGAIFILRKPKSRVGDRSPLSVDDIRMPAQGQRKGYTC